MEAGAHAHGGLQRRAPIECRLATRRVTSLSSSLRGSFFDDSLGASLMTSLSFFAGGVAARQGAEQAGAGGGVAGRHAGAALQ